MNGFFIKFRLGEGANSAYLYLWRQNDEYSKWDKNGVVEAADLVPTLQQLDAKIADARRAQ